MTANTYQSSQHSPLCDVVMAVSVTCLCLQDTGQTRNCWAQCVQCVCPNNMLKKQHPPSPQECCETAAVHAGGVRHGIVCTRQGPHPGQPLTCGPLPSTCLAVAACTSCPSAKACSRASSPDRAAMTRSSTCTTHMGGSSALPPFSASLPSFRCAHKQTHCWRSSMQVGGGW